MPAKKKHTTKGVAHIARHPYRVGQVWKTAGGHTIRMVHDGNDDAHPDRMLAVVVKGGHGLNHMRGAVVGEQFSLMKIDGSYPTRIEHPPADLKKLAGMVPVKMLKDAPKKKSRKSKR